MHATDYNGRRVKLIIEVAVIGEMKIVRFCHLWELKKLPSDGLRCQCQRFPAKSAFLDALQRSGKNFFSKCLINIFYPVRRASANKMNKRAAGWTTLV
jgi:hypothetical protein